MEGISKEEDDSKDEDSLDEPIEEAEEVIEIQSEDKKDENVIITSNEIKQSYRYLMGRHLGKDGLPDNFGFIHQLIIAFLGEKKFIDVLNKELDEIESKNIGIKKKDVFDAIHRFKKEYFMCHFVTRQIRELDDKYEKENKEGQPRKSFIADELRKIVIEMNTDLPNINDYLYIALSIIVKNSDLKFESAPREQIFAPSPRYESTNRTKFAKENIEEEKF